MIRSYEIDISFNLFSRVIIGGIVTNLTPSKQFVYLQVALVQFISIFLIVRQLYLDIGQRKFLGHTVREYLAKNNS